MSLTGPDQPRPLGKNINGYFGETIEVASVLRDCVELAQTTGWNIELIPVNTNLALAAFKKPGQVPTAASGQPARHTPRVYISAGIHGDEPAGQLAIRQLFQENRWPADMAFWICPRLNPSGFINNRRENPDGVDLNRQYLNPHAAETLAHIAWLEAQPNFD